MVDEILPLGCRWGAPRTPREKNLAAFAKQGEPPRQVDVVAREHLIEHHLRHIELHLAELRRMLQEPK